MYNGGTSGGQIKVRDSFEHLRQSERFDPKVYFNPATIWFDNPGNVWLPYRHSQYEIKTWQPSKNDILFFAGVDWMVLDPSERQRPQVPIVNIAHPRHIRPEDKRHGYLQHPAVRITKSSLSKKLLDEYGVNGPVFVIPDAVDPDDFPTVNTSPHTDILIVGLKNPGLAKRLYKKLKWKNFLKGRSLNIKYQVPPKLPTRRDFLNLLNDASIIVFLPLEAKEGSEGFYLPALEAMVLQKFVICPYAVGNVDFCIHNKTCLMPEYNEKSILNAIEIALEMDTIQRQSIIDEAFRTSHNHHIDIERSKLVNLVDGIDDLWQEHFPDLKA